jgi:hypothetical protein
VERLLWQFQLWHIFGFTTYVSVVAALVRFRGTGVLVVAAGIALVGLNWLGAFERLQKGGRQRVVLGLAWLTFLTSLFLPSVAVFNPINGAQAAWAAIALPWEALWEERPPFGPILFYAGIDLANLLMVALPLIMWRVARVRWQILGALLGMTAVMPWCVALDTKGALVGYYVWSASFAIAVLAIRVPTWLLVTMTAEALMMILALR